MSWLIWAKGNIFCWISLKGFWRFFYTFVLWRQCYFHLYTISFLSSFWLEARSAPQMTDRVQGSMGWCGMCERADCCVYAREGRGGSRVKALDARKLFRIHKLLSCTTDKVILAAAQSPLHKMRNVSAQVVKDQEPHGDFELNIVLEMYVIVHKWHNAMLTIHFQLGGHVQRWWGRVRVRLPTDVTYKGLGLGD